MCQIDIGCNWDNYRKNKIFAGENYFNSSITLWGYRNCTGQAWHDYDISPGDGAFGPNGRVECIARILQTFKDPMILLKIKILNL